MPGIFLARSGRSCEHRGRKIFYTGDVNFTDQTLLRGADFPRSGIDVLITETTRGAQPRPEGFTRENVVEQLAVAIEETFAKGGAVLMPVFAMGKTQELLAQLHFFQKSRRLPQTPIYIGGLGRAFCEIYDRLAGRTRRKYPNLNLLDDIAPQVMDGRRARDFSPKKGHIYLISSGMMTENTLSNVFAQEFLANERHSIFFVGYCDPESPAGKCAGDEIWRIGGFERGLWPAAGALPGAAFRFHRPCAAGGHHQICHGCAAARLRAGPW